MSTNAAPVAYACRKCGRAEARWHSQCAGCGAHNSIAAASHAAAVLVAAHRAADGIGVAMAPPFPSPFPRTLTSDTRDARTFEPREALPMPAQLAEAPLAMPMRLLDVPEESFQRQTCAIEPVDRVLGGGLVAGSSVILGGSPGAGKSTLLMQIAAGIGGDLLYVTGEESPGQVTARARRIGAVTDRIWVIAETDVDRILAHADRMRPTVLAIDSIQTMQDAGVPSAIGSVAQVKACANKICSFGHDRGITQIMIGHVTKDGSLGGPRTLEHLVDVVLSLETDDEFPQWVRFLRTPKNRHGTTNVAGSLEMTATGLVASDVAPAEGERGDPDAIYQPLAQELLNRYLAGGGNVDDGLRDRIGELLDLEMWRETR